MLPYVGNYGIAVVEFKRTTSWQKEILDTLLKMELLFKRRREKRQAVGREEYQIAIKIVGDMVHDDLQYREKVERKFPTAILESRNGYRRCCLISIISICIRCVWRILRRQGMSGVGECCRGI